MDEARGKPTFLRWMKLSDGESLAYGNLTFRKGGDDDKKEEERLLKRLVSVANINNKKKTKHHDALVTTMVGRKEVGKTVRVRVSVGGTEEDGAERAVKKRHIGGISREEALPFVSTNRSFLEWEKLKDGQTMNYGSRFYTKGVPKMEEKLLGHIVRTQKQNAKRQRKGQRVAAATKEGEKTIEYVPSENEVVARGQKGQGDLIALVDNLFYEAVMKEEIDIMKTTTKYFFRLVEKHTEKQKLSKTVKGAIKGRLLDLIKHHPKMANPPASAPAPAPALALAPSPASALAPALDGATAGAKSSGPKWIKLIRERKHGVVTCELKRSKIGQFFPLIRSINGEVIRGDENGCEPCILKKVQSSCMRCLTHT